MGLIEQKADAMLVHDASSTTKTNLHYSQIEQVPWDLHKYFHQRQKIFSRYDEGVQMTDDAWFGVTPEPIANAIATYLSGATPPQYNTIIDCFAGVGGNAIAFAASRRWKHVIAIEKDPIVLQCAKHNAELYDVSDNITWCLGDCFDILKLYEETLKNQCVVFASPPWGGPAYNQEPIFDLSQMLPYSLTYLCQSLSCLSPCVAIYLPRNADLRQIAQAHTSNQRIKVTHYCIDGASKALCAYFGFDVGGE